MNLNEVEIRTLSITTAGALIAMGCEPLGVAKTPAGRYMIRFAPETVAALQRYQAAKARAEQMFEQAAQ